MISIHDEIAAYDEMRPELEARHIGEWVVVRNRKLIGLYPTFELAAGEAIKKFGRGPYLIREVGAAPLTLPASVMYHRDARD